MSGGATRPLGELAKTVRSKNAGVDKITFVSDDEAALHALYERVHAAFGERATVAQSQTYYLDVTALAANKGDGIAALAKALDVDLARVPGLLALERPVLVVAGAQVALTSFLLSLTRIGEDASAPPPVTAAAPPVVPRHRRLPGFQAHAARLTAESALLGLIAGAAFVLPGAALMILLAWVAAARASLRGRAEAVRRCAPGEGGCGGGRDGRRGSRGRERRRLRARPEPNPVSGTSPRGCRVR